MSKLKEYRDTLMKFHHELKLNSDHKASLMAGRLRSERKKRKLTQTDLAALLNLSRVQLTNIESGTSGVSLKTLIKICDVLDTDPNHLLGYDS